MSHLATIDTLEPRLLFATFTGTAAADTIRIVAPSSGPVQISINGGAAQSTTDSSIVINALGGNDTVYFPVLADLSDPPEIQVNLGDGDDYATNFDNLSSIGSLANIRFPVFVRGDAGNDTLAIENTSGGGTQTYVFGAGDLILGPADWDVELPLLVENVIVDGSSGADEFWMLQKASGLRVTVNGGGGPDTFEAGTPTRLIWGGTFPAYNFSETGWTAGTTTLTGGSGIDTVNIYDAKAATGGLYVEDTSSVTKGAHGFTYAGMESQQISIASQSELQINSMNGLITNTSVFAAENSTVRLGNGNLSNLVGTFAVSSAALVLNDAAVTQTLQYSVETGSITRTVNFGSPMTITVNPANVGQLFIEAGTIADEISIAGVPAQRTVYARGNGGNDILNIGAPATGGVGNLDTVLGRVEASGGAGIDEVYVYDNNNTASASFNVTGISVARNAGPAHAYDSAETLRLNVGPGGSNADVTSLSVPALFNGNSGPDVINIGGGDWDTNLPMTGTACSFFGQGGTDTINIDDTDDTNPNPASFQDTYIVTTTGGNQIIRRSDNQQRNIMFSSENITLHASNVANQISVSNAQLALRVEANGGSDIVTVADASAPVIVNTGLGDSDSLTVNYDAGAGDAPVTVVVDANDDVETLDIRAGGTLRLPADRVLVKTRDAATPGAFSLAGTIDLAGGTFVSRAGGPTQASFRNQLMSGRNGGAWNGTSPAGAINSSLASGSGLPDAVGYGLGSEIAPQAIGPFDIFADDVVMRYTFEGDADLNGVVNFDDYSRTDIGFINNRTGWVNGDYDYNGVINFDDYSLIDFAFNGQGSGRTAMNSLIDDIVR